MAETRSPDLFDWLLARTGLAESLPMAQPRPAQPFERLQPAPLTELEIEVDAPAPYSPVSEPLGGNAERARHAPQVEIRPSVLRQIERTVRSFETVRSVPAKAERAEAAGVVRTVTERLVPPVVPAAPAAVTTALDQQPVPGGPAPGRPAAVLAEPSAGAAAPARPIVRAAPRHAAEPGRNAGDSAAEPIVQVSIGRLEVTTAAPALSSSRESARKRPKPSVGLADFLNGQEAT